jgi:hypothetical protein
VPTIRDVLTDLDERLFVGREPEVALFRDSLAQGTAGPTILALSGSGGMGKSTLLRAFRRIAEGQGWRVVYADGSAFEATPEGLSRTITGAHDSDGADYLNEARTVLLLDSFEKLGPLTHHLQEQFLPRLYQTVNVVIAGRRPLGMAWSGWQPVVQSIVLSGFEPEASSKYLYLRGIAPELAAEIAQVAGGIPLALSLAADMATQHGVREFPAAAEWHLAVRSLVEELLRDVGDQDLRILLEAAAVLREFDEELLAAVAEKEDITAAFAALCRLSFIRPAQHGLTLHDEVRRILIEDLRWRRPEHLIELRRRAWRHYRRRMRESPLQAWMIADELHLSGNDLVQAMLFQESETGIAWAQRARPSDRREILQILQAFTSQGASLPDAPTPEEVDSGFVESLLSHPAARMTMARERDGRFAAYAFVLPICRQTMGLLPAGGAVRRLVERTSSAAEFANLPDDCEDASIYVLSTIARSAELSREATAALVQDVLNAILAGGKYLACTASAQYAEVLRAFGFAKVASELGPSAFDPDRQLDAFALDLRLVGVEAWIDSVIGGYPLTQQLAVEDIGAEVQAVLLHWADDAQLEASPLVAIAAGRDPESGLGPADRVRELIRDALERARAGASDDRELAFRAVELAYLERSVSQERVAERLSVSRSTFYRLLKRGVAGVAAALGRP